MIKNLDESPNLIEPEVVQTNVAVPEDYNYKPEDMLYKNQDTFQWYILIPCAAAVSILWVVIIRVVKRYKNRKEMSCNEK